MLNKYVYGQYNLQMPYTYIYKGIYNIYERYIQIDSFGNADQHTSHLIKAACVFINMQTPNIYIECKSLHESFP